MVGKPRKLRVARSRTPETNAADAIQEALAGAAAPVPLRFDSPEDVADALDALQAVLAGAAAPVPLRFDGPEDAANALDALLKKGAALRISECAARAAIRDRGLNLLSDADRRDLVSVAGSVDCAGEIEAFCILHDPRKISRLPAKDAASENAQRRKRLANVERLASSLQKQLKEHESDWRELFGVELYLVNRPPYLIAERQPPLLALLEELQDKAKVARSLAVGRSGKRPRDYVMDNLVLMLRRFLVDEMKFRESAAEGSRMVRVLRIMARGFHLEGEPRDVLRRELKRWNAIRASLVVRGLNPDSFDGGVSPL